MIPLMGGDGGGDDGEDGLICSIRESTWRMDPIDRAADILAKPRPELPPLLIEAEGFPLSSEEDHRQPGGGPCIQELRSGIPCRICGRKSGTTSTCEGGCRLVGNSLELHPCTCGRCSGGIPLVNPPLDRVRVAEGSRRKGRRTEDFEFRVTCGFDLIFHPHRVSGR
jgi:hypothetical protein